MGRYDFDGETRTVDVHVRTLRQKLGETGRLVETVRGVGYRMADKGGSGDEKKILSHTGFMIVLTAILTFIAASFLMYEKFDDVMKRTVRDETEYVKAGMEKAGEDYLSKRVGDNTGTRITLTDENGKVLYDSEADASKLPNQQSSSCPGHGEEGHGEVVRYSETLAQQTFYYAVKLDDGKILRLAKTTDSVFHTLMGSLIWLGLLMIVIILIEIILVQRQTKKADQTHKQPGSGASS